MARQKLADETEFIPRSLAQQRQLYMALIGQGTPAQRATGIVGALAALPANDLSEMTWTRYRAELARLGVPPWTPAPAPADRPAARRRSAAAAVAQTGLITMALATALPISVSLTVIRENEQDAGIVDFLAAVEAREARKAVGMAQWSPESPALLLAA